MSFARALSTALRSVVLAVAPPIETLITEAPWPAAHVIPAAIVASVGFDLAVQTTTGRILALAHTPAAASPRVRRAAIRPATMVPCPAVSAVLPERVSTFQPGSKEP
jgi:hypothetical protein